jgi:hypothetical protein
LLHLELKALRFPQVTRLPPQPQERARLMLYLPLILQQSPAPKVWLRLQR